MTPMMRLLLLQSAFRPPYLFRNGEQGVWYDPSDFSTMYQDAAGTTPVTATGQPVGKILDKSGRGNHASQSTATSRPTLQQDASGYYYLSFDGVDDSLATGSIDFTATDKMSVFAGVYKAADISGAVVELSSSPPTNSGVFGLLAPSGGGTNFLFRSKGTADSLCDSGSFPAPIAKVLTALGTIAADANTIRLNGSQVASSSTDQGTGNFGSYPLYIGSRAGTSLPFNGRIYSLIVRGAASSATEIINTERWVGRKMGIGGL